MLPYYFDDYFLRLVIRIILDNPRVPKTIQTKAGIANGQVNPEGVPVLVAVVIKVKSPDPETRFTTRYAVISPTGV